MANQCWKKNELVLWALNDLVLNEPDKVIDLYESFKHASDPEVFKNEPDKIDECLDGYTPTEIITFLASDYSYYGDKYARFDESLESGNDLTELIDFDELASQIVDSGNAPKWFDRWVDEDDLQEAITNYIADKSSHTEDTNKIRDFVEGCSLSINDDWDDILDDWEHERKAKGMATAITE